MDDGSEDRDKEPTDSRPASTSDETASEPSVEALREQVEEKYDFDDFGPRDMEEMSADEWDVAFDPGTWITGRELLDRVERDVKQRIADRDVFARLERVDDPNRLIAYSDVGYAVVYEDGTVTGEGTVLRDIKPSVALCSMEEYDPPEMISGEVLPDPEEISEGSGQLGHLVLQIVGGLLGLMGITLIGVSVIGLLGDAAAVGFGTGLIFLIVGLLLLLVVANARLSDRFRATEYRDRLRAIGAGGEGRPDALDEIAEGSREKHERDDDSNGSHSPAR